MHVFGSLASYILHQIRAVLSAAAGIFWRLTCHHKGNLVMHKCI